jgi:hypothetical protein
MHNHFSVHSDEMALAVVLWFCSLPLVGMLTLPALGLSGFTLLALILLSLAMVFCWGVCRWNSIKKKHH